MVIISLPLVMFILKITLKDDILNLGYDKEGFNIRLTSFPFPLQSGLFKHFFGVLE